MDSVEVSRATKMKIQRENYVERERIEKLKSSLDLEKEKWKKQYAREAHKMKEKLERYGKQCHNNEKNAESRGRSRRAVYIRQDGTDSRNNTQTATNDNSSVFVTHMGGSPVTQRRNNEGNSNLHDGVPDQQVSPSMKRKHSEERVRTVRESDEMSTTSTTPMGPFTSYIDRMKKSFEDPSLDKEVANMTGRPSSLPNSPRLSRKDVRKMNSLNTSVEVRRLSGSRPESPYVRSNSLTVPTENSQLRQRCSSPSLFFHEGEGRGGDRSGSSSPRPPRQRSASDTTRFDRELNDSPRQRRVGTATPPILPELNSNGMISSPTVSRRKISPSSPSLSPRRPGTPTAVSSPLFRRRHLRENSDGSTESSPDRSRQYQTSNMGNPHRLQPLKPRDRLKSRSLELLYIPETDVPVRRSVSTVTAPSQQGLTSPSLSTERLQQYSTNTPPRTTPSSSPSSSRRASSIGALNDRRNTPSTSPNTSRRTSSVADTVTSSRSRSSSWGTFRATPKIVVEGTVDEHITKVPLHKKHTAATRKKSLGPAHFFIHALDLHFPCNNETTENGSPVTIPPLYQQEQRRLTPRDFSYRPPTPTFSETDYESMKTVRYLRTKENDIDDDCDISVINFD